MYKTNLMCIVCDVCCVCMEILLMMTQSINELCQCVVQCVDQCMSQGHDPGDLLMLPFSMNISGPMGSCKTYYIKDLLKLPQFEGSLVHRSIR